MNWRTQRKLLVSFSKSIEIERNKACAKDERKKNEREKLRTKQFHVFFFCQKERKKIVRKKIFDDATVLRCITGRQVATEEKNSFESKQFVWFPFDHFFHSCFSAIFGIKFNLDIESWELRSCEWLNFDAESLLIEWDEHFEQLMNNVVHILNWIKVGRVSSKPSSSPDEWIDHYSAYTKDVQWMISIIDYSNRKPWPKIIDLFNKRL